MAMDSAGYDFRVQTPQAEWLYEVKSSLEDTRELELTSNGMRVATVRPDAAGDDAAFSMVHSSWSCRIR